MKLTSERRTLNVSSMKYYVISFGMLMAMTGSVIVLAEEAEQTPPVFSDEYQDKSYLFQEDVSEPVIEDNNIIIEIIEPDQILEQEAEQTSEQELTEAIIDEQVVQEQPVTEGPGTWGSDSTGTYYVVDGNRLTSTVVNIDSYYYGFNSSGYLYKATDFYLNPNYYRAKEDGKLYVNEWYDSEFGAKYYYGSQGKAVNGLMSVDSNLYYFENGLMVVDRAFEANGTSYFANSDGFPLQMGEGQNTYYDKYGSECIYYVVDGSFLKSQIHSEGGSYYFYDSYGKMVKSGTGSIYTGGKYRDVRAWADGTLYQDEWYYESSYGNRYYYGPACYTLPGFNNVEGKMYYFEPNGRQYYNQAATIDGKVYIFNEDGTYYQATADGWYQTQSDKYYVRNGKLLTGALYEGNTMYYFRPDGRLLVNDIINDTYENGTMYYYGADWEGHVIRNNFFMGYYFNDAGRTLPNGFQKIGDYDYYFEHGKYVKDTIRNINGTNYIFDITGAMYKAPEGISINIHTYYVKNGQLANGLYTVDGKQRFFVDGIMQQDRVFQYSENEYGAALADGTIVKSGWDEVKYPLDPLLSSGAVYANQNGKLVNGLKVIDGKTYIFGVDAYTPYILNRNNMVKNNGTWYYADSNGVATVVNVDNDLVDKGQDKFFIRNGELVKHEILYIGTGTYAFDEYGKAVINGLWTTRDPAYKVYYADSSGKIVKNQWVLIQNQGNKDGVYYFGWNGVGYEGFRTVNGNEYYFVDGRRMGSEIRPINGELYKFNDSGSQYTIGVADGVYTSGRSLQVVRNGVLVTNELYPYMGQYYLIDGTGHSIRQQGVHIMDFIYRRTTPVYFYQMADGHISQRNRISTTTGLDYFSGDDGFIKEGLITYTDGYQYAVVNDAHRYYEGCLTHAAKNVEVTIRGKKYYADETGRLLTTKPMPFSDVPQGSWFYDVAKECYETGLISGTSATTFSPYQEMTRAMVVTILWRLEGQPSVSFNNKFSDVSSKQWYASSISWAANVGVVHGYGDGTFKPDAPVTREQIAIMLANYAQYKGLYVPGTKKLNTYPDGYQVSSYAQAGMKWAISNGIISGNGEGYLNPKKSATRAEGAAMLLRMKKWLVNK